MKGLKQESVAVSSCIGFSLRTEVQDIVCIKYLITNVLLLGGIHSEI